ncbi:MAG TPA: EamA family transporter [Bryobacteraceae bacterium]|nr:EamA family transporter [Bryobacteraceae bacterium]
MTVTWALVGVIVLSTATGEVLQAMGMRHHGEVRDFRPGAIRRLLALLARNRYIIASVCAMAVSFFAFMSLLSVSDLSFAVPVTAVTYVLETALAKFLLKERICWGRWIGASLVALGVGLLAL